MCEAAFQIRVKQKWEYVKLFLIKSIDIYGELTVYNVA